MTAASAETSAPALVPAPALDPALRRGGIAGGLGSAALLLGAVATPWNAVAVGGLQLGDGLFAVSLGLLLFAAMQGRRSLSLPWWLTLLAVVAAAVAIAQVFAPVDGGYVMQRFVLVAYGGGRLDQPSDNLVHLMHWEVALFALPLAAVLAGRVAKNGFAHRLATAWLIGCAASALVALTDSLGVTSISATLLPFTDAGGRQAGLTSQPNNVAVAAAMALPVAVYWAARPGRGRVFGIGCALVLLGGTFAAGSRGGSAAAILALLISLAATPSGRRLLPRLLIVAMVAAPLLVAALSDTWTSLRQSLRLGGESSGVASDLGREMLARQALHDFEHAPLRGIGLWVITESHSIYLQLLASGGLVLLLAFVVFVVGAVRSGVTSSRLTGDPFGLLMAISIGTWALVGAVENQLTDRYLYLPAACLACLAAALVSTAYPGVCRPAADKSQG